MARLQPIFPKSRGKPRVDDRLVLIGIIFMNRDGMLSPVDFETRQQKMNEAGVWETGDTSYLSPMEIEPRAVLG